MIRLDDLALFVRTAALGSFSAAAREAGLLPGQASAAIARLERALGRRLFARSTRSLRLTAEGEQYLPCAREALDALDDGRRRLAGDEDHAGGVLQIAAPSDFGRNVLLPWLGEFRRAHPKLALRLHVSDRVSDVFREPVDVAIRLGALDDSDGVALPLAPGNRRVLAAAPDYLARHGRPASLEALRGHACLRFMLGPQPYAHWSFGVGGRRQRVHVDGPLLSDDADVVHRWALAGEGILYKSWLDVAGDVAAGRLEVLFPEAGEPLPLSLLCPHRQQVSPTVRKLHALLRKRCAALLAGLPG